MNDLAQTALDDFVVPDLPKIHPYDLYDLLLGAKSIEVGEYVEPVDEEDYKRNQLKIGRIVTINGQAYWQTCYVAHHHPEFEGKYGKPRP